MFLLVPLLAACSGSVKTDDTSGGGSDTDSGSSLAAPPVVINEFLASNQSTNQDPAGEYDDWIELHNAGTTLVQFDGLYLSDDPENPLKWALPTGQGIDAGGYALFWADDDDGISSDTGDTGDDVSQGDRHLSFKLSASGETVLLTYAEGGESVQADAIEFGNQQPDVSAARVPDGSLNWEYGTPTPNASNGT